MGYFPGYQSATTSPRSRHPGGGGGGSSTPTPIKTGPGLSEEENTKRMAENRARGVGDAYGRSPSDPNYGKGATAPKSQFKKSGGAAVVSESVKVEKDANVMLANLALKQQVSRESRAYASSTAEMVFTSPARRENLKQETTGGVYDTYFIGGGRTVSSGPVSMLPQPLDSSTGFSSRSLPIYNYLTPEQQPGRGKVITVAPPVQTLSWYQKLEGRASPYAKKVSGFIFNKPFLEEQRNIYAYKYYKTGELGIEGRLAFARYGFVSEFEERPIKQTALFAGAALLPVAISGGRYALATYGVEGSFPVRAAGAVLKYGAPSIYAGVTAAEIYAQPNAVKRWETVGRKTSEFAVLYAGGRLGIKFATPIEYKTALVQEVKKLPVEKQIKFWELYKEAKLIEKSGVPAKKFDLSGFERIPKKARPIIKDFLVEKDVVVYGSAGQRPFLYGKSASRSYAQSDIDVASLLKGSANKDALALARTLKAAGIARVSVVPGTGRVTIAGQKAVEFHEYSKLYGNIRQVVPFYKPASSQFAVTPDGVTVLKPAVQARRKLVGAYLDEGRFSKDMPDFRRILGSAYYRAEVQAGKSAFFQRERIEELELFRGQKAQLSLGRVEVKEELPEVFPTRLRTPRTRVSFEYEYPDLKYESPRYRTPTASGAYSSLGTGPSAVIPPAYPSPSYKPDEITMFKYKPYLPDVKIQYKYTPIISPASPYGGGGGRGGYTSPSPTPYPQPAPSPYTTRLPAISRKTPPTKPPDIDFTLKGMTIKGKSYRRRPFKYQASLKAIVGGLRGKRRRRLTGFEIRGIPSG